MASKALNNLKRRILFQRNGMTATEKNCMMMRLVNVELTEMKEHEKMKALLAIELDMDIRTKKHDDLISELKLLLREREMLLRVRWH